MDGHPWEHVPSGSTTHPSVQQAGDVASHIALRVKSSRVSGVNPSFSRASVAVIRYGFCFVVFIILYGHQLPAEPTESPPWILRKIQASMKCPAPFPWGGIWTLSKPPRAPAHSRHTEHGVPSRSLAQSCSPVEASEPTRKVDQPIERAMTSSATESTLAIKRVFHGCREGFRH